MEKNDFLELPEWEMQEGNLPGLSLEEELPEALPENTFRFLEAPLWPGEMGSNYLYYLEIFPSSAGFLPMARILEACLEGDPPYDVCALAGKVVKDLGYSSRRKMEQDMQFCLRMAIRDSGGGYIWQVMGRSWSRSLPVYAFLCAAAMDLRRRLRDYARLHQAGEGIQSLVQTGE